MRVSITSRMMPTPDDHAACLVAIDLVEEGRLDEARKLLEEQAPRRLNRKCLACGAYQQRPCDEYVEKTRPFKPIWIYQGAAPGPEKETYRVRVARIVPHLSRVEPGR